MTENKLVVLDAGTPEAKKAFNGAQVLYQQCGQPLACIWYVLGDAPSMNFSVDLQTSLRALYGSTDDIRSDDLATLHAQVKELTPKEYADFTPTQLSYLWATKEALVKVFNQEGEFEDALSVASVSTISELDEEELSALFNDAIRECKEFIGSKEIQELIEAVQGKLVGDYGDSSSLYYTYNDPDSYCGNDDIQVTWNHAGDSCYGNHEGFQLVFVQVHPGGDARNMATGLFYVLGAIDEFYNLFDTLGTNVCELGTTLEIPTAFPLEQYLREHENEHWQNDIYREEVEQSDGGYAMSEVLHRSGYTSEGMCQVYLTPADENVSCRVYGCYEVADYCKHNWWEFVPKGTIIKEEKVTWGVSATPWKNATYQYSTDGYFKWVGPLPGTDEWKEMLEELNLPEIPAFKPENDKQKKLAL